VSGDAVAAPVCLADDELDDLALGGGEEGIGPAHGAGEPRYALRAAVELAMALKMLKCLPLSGPSKISLTGPGAEAGSMFFRRGM